MQSKKFLDHRFDHQKIIYWYRALMLIKNILAGCKYWGILQLDSVTFEAYRNEIESDGKITNFYAYTIKTVEVTLTRVVKRPLVDSDQLPPLTVGRSLRAPECDTRPLFSDVFNPRFIPSYCLTPTVLQWESKYFLLLFGPNFPKHPTRVHFLFRISEGSLLLNRRSTGLVSWHRLYILRKYSADIRTKKNELKILLECTKGFFLEKNDKNH